MSDSFKEREKGFERKHQLDQDQAFRVQSKRDKTFGLWVAGQLGKSGADADTYAREVVDSNFQKPGDEVMLDKVRADLKAANLSIDNETLHAELNKAEVAAVQAVKGSN